MEIDRMNYYFTGEDSYSNDDFVGSLYLNGGVTLQKQHD